LRLVANKGVVCAAYTASEHFGMFRSTDDRREEAFGMIGAGETSANSARAIVEDDGCGEKGIRGHCEVVEGRSKRAMGVLSNDSRLAFNGSGLTFAMFDDT